MAPTGQSRNNTLSHKNIAIQGLTPSVDISPLSIFRELDRIVMRWPNAEFFTAFIPISGVLRDSRPDKHRYGKASAGALRRMRPDTCPARRKKPGQTSPALHFSFNAAIWWGAKMACALLMAIHSVRAAYDTVTERPNQRQRLG